MATQRQPVRFDPAPALDRPIHILPVPWRDPHTVSSAELASYTEFLEKACEEHPQSADLRTCLGMAYAMGHHAYKSMDTLESAIRVDETHFFAQFKYAELLYRLRALPRAERESSRALDLAGNGWELSLARKQLQEIRRLMHEGTQRPEWTEPLVAPALALLALFGILSVIMVVLK